MRECSYLRNYHAAIEFYKELDMLQLLL